MEQIKRQEVEVEDLLIGVSGKKKSGKDTVGIHLSLSYNMFKYAFADALKELCCSAFTMSEYDLFDVDYKEFMFFDFSINQELVDSFIKSLQLLATPIGITLTEEQKCKIQDLLLDRTFKSAREMMQHIGTEVVRNVVSDTFWIDVLHHRIKNKNRVVITDARFPNEREYIKSRGGKLLLVKRDTDIKDYHISENALNDEKEYDGVINNNKGIRQLEMEVDEFYKCISNGKIYRKLSLWEKFINLFKRKK